MDRLEFKRGLDDIARWDFAQLLGRPLTEMADDADLGRFSLATVRLAGLLDVLRPCSGVDEQRVKSAVSSPDFIEARRAFASANAWRQDGVDRLWGAIKIGSARSVIRWAWAGRAYARAVREMIEARERVAVGRAAERALESSSGAKVLPQYPMLRCVYTEYEKIRTSVEPSRWDIRGHLASGAREAVEGSGEFRKHDAAMLRQCDVLINALERLGAGDRAREIIAGEPLPAARMAALGGCFAAARAARVRMVAATAAEGASLRLAEVFAQIARVRAENPLDFTAVKPAPRNEDDTG
jgi:hypothetical protein